MSEKDCNFYSVITYEPFSLFYCYLFYLFYSEEGKAVKTSELLLPFQLYTGGTVSSETKQHSSRIMVLHTRLFVAVDLLVFLSIPFPGLRR